MTYISISEKLFWILETVKAQTDSKLTQCFSYETSSPDDLWFPYASLAQWDMTEEIIDTCTNKALYTFLIRVSDVQKDKTVMELRMRGLCDDILAELRKQANLYLWGTVDNILPFQVVWGWETSSQIPSRYFEITVRVQKLHSII